MNEPKLEHIPCNLCGSERSVVEFHRPYKLDTVSECATYAATTDEFQSYGRIVRCRDCGLVYTDPRPAPGALLKGYEECVDEAYLSESSSRSINAHLSLNTLKRFCRTGKLLEVGASTGYFLNAARVDFDVAGLEPSEWACRIAREKFKLDVYPESFDATKRFEPASLDVISMIDVIEHLSDPLAAVRRAAELLKPGGVLYLVTPDVGSLSASLLRGYWWGLRPAHIYYFDKHTLRRLLEKAGFQVVLSKSFGRIFSWGYWASRLRHYPGFIYNPVRGIIRGLDIEDKLLYLDTRDSIEICARKK
ncbi:MAG: class I SAM-dependent methyltransferase [Elusimicrobia bacterium]|nr:class I SAM-dependent methyltransferase [Elusimicrobiota bacterium]